MLRSIAGIRRYPALLSGTAVASGGVLYYQTLKTEDKRRLKISAQGLVRFVRTLGIGATISIDYWVTNNFNPDRISDCHKRCSNRILDGCLLNGGVYVKLGQGLVAMNHILPEEYLDTLEVLHDRALRSLPFSEVEQIFIEELGKKPDELFLSFEKECVAAASLAQVFKAQTEQGQDVAVKIQYIDLRQRFTGDVWVLGILVSLVGWMHPDYNFRWVLDYLRESLVKELDFELEADNMRKCKQQLSSLPYIKVPEVVEKLSSKRILTMEWIDGVKINQTDTLKQMGYSLYDIDLKLITAFAKQVFDHGFLHGDPHPGNVLVAKNESRPKDPYIVLLDHGLYETLQSADRLSLCSLWRSIVYNDNEGMKKHSATLGVPDAHHRVFCEMLVQRPLLFRSKTGIPLAKGLSKSEMEYMKNMASQRFDEIMTCLKVLPRPMLLVFRNINTVRSIAKTHGHPVDRFSVMARLADKAIVKHSFERMMKADQPWLLSLLRSLTGLVLSSIQYSYRRLHLEAYLLMSWISDLVVLNIQRIIRRLNRDIDNLALEMEEKRNRRERLSL